MLLVFLESAMMDEHFFTFFKVFEDEFNCFVCLSLAEGHKSEKNTCVLSFFCLKYFFLGVFKFVY